MKRILLALLMLLSLVNPLCAQAAPDAAELTKLLNDFLAGAGRNDAAIHERFWANDLIYTASAGRRLSKQDILKEVRERLRFLVNVGLETKRPPSARRIFVSSSMATPRSWLSVLSEQRRRRVRKKLPII